MENQDFIQNSRRSQYLKAASGMENWQSIQNSCSNQEGRCV